MDMVPWLAPRSDAIGVRRRYPARVIIRPRIMLIANPVEAISDASLFFFAPNILDKQFPDPCPHRNPNACITAITGNTSPTAAVACVLIFPTKKVSAML